MPRKASPLAGDRPKVLFIRFSSLGDIVLALPAVASLKKARPGARITFMTKKAYEPVLRASGYVDDVLSLGDGGDRTGLRELAALCRQAGETDLIIDLHGSIRSFFCRMLIRAPAVAYDKASLARRMLLRGAGLQRAALRHVADRYLDTLREVGIEGAVTDPELPVTDAEKGQSARFLQSQGVEDPGRLAVMAPGAKWPNKRWSTEGFAELARSLRQDFGLQPLIVGDSKDAVVAAILKRGIGGNVVDITGKTGIRELIAVLSQAAIFIGNDSGPGHLAAAAGAPTVVVFGPTSESFGFTPRGRRARTVSLPLPCRPCSLHGGRTCPVGERACLDGIDAGQVLDAAAGLLREGPDR